MSACRAKKGVSTRRSFSFLFAVALLACVSSFFPFVNQSAHSADVSLQWDANTESTLAGYRIHYGLSSGSYPTTLDVGKHTSCVISDLVPGEEYFFVATAYDTSGNESGYSNQVSCTIEDSTDSTVIDNGDRDTSYTGTWIASGAPDYYGTESLYSRSGAAYTWSFLPETTGYYQVAMWWTEWSSRSTGVPVSIAHASGTARLNVNQQINGGQWNDLGKYLFEAGVRYNITLSAPNPYPTSYCADAVRIAFVEEATAPSNDPPVAKNDIAATQVNKAVVINVLSNDTDSDGSLNSSSCSVVREPARGYANVGSNGTITYSPQSNFSGTDSFTYTVRDNDGALSNEATVTITVSAASTGQEVIIDNGTNGTSYTGTWAVSGGTGSYGSNSLWSRSGATYSWTFTPSVSGSYQVAMWWAEYSSRSTNVPITIRHAAGSSTVYVDQRTDGGQWNDLGTYRFSAGTQYRLTLSAPDPYPTSYCADAVKFTPTAAGTDPAENQPPVARDDTATTAMDTAVTIDVLANDSDADGTINASTCAVSGTSFNGGTVSVDSDGSVTYTPQDGFAGTDAFRYTVNDNDGAMSNEATVTVTVTAGASGSQEIIIDNGDSGTSSTGTWAISGGSGFYGDNSLWSRSGATYTWSFTPSESGYYEVSMWWASYSSRSTEVPIDISYSGGSSTIYVDQKIDGGMWNELGEYYFQAGRQYNVTLHAPNPWPTSYCADAVRLVRTGQ